MQNVNVKDLWMYEDIDRQAIWMDPTIAILRRSKNKLLGELPWPCFIDSCLSQLRYGDGDSLGISSLAVISPGPFILFYICIEYGGRFGRLSLWILSRGSFASWISLWNTFCNRNDYCLVKNNCGDGTSDYTFLCLLHLAPLRIKKGVF